jgi:hypothetical protein
VRVAPDLSSETCRARIFLIALRAISSLRELRMSQIPPGDEHGSYKKILSSLKRKTTRRRENRRVATGFRRLQRAAGYYSAAASTGRMYDTGASVASSKVTTS